MIYKLRQSIGIWKPYSFIGIQAYSFALIELISFSFDAIYIYRWDVINLSLFSSIKICGISFLSNVRYVSLRPWAAWYCAKRKEAVSLVFLVIMHIITA